MWNVSGRSSRTLSGGLTTMQPYMSTNSSSNMIQCMAGGCSPLSGLSGNYKRLKRTTKWVSSHEFQGAKNSLVKRQTGRNHATEFLCRCKSKSYPPGLLLCHQVHNCVAQLHPSLRVPLWQRKIPQRLSLRFECLHPIAHVCPSLRMGILQHLR
jgi:hypothetical protein